MVLVRHCTHEKSASSVAISRVYMLAAAILQWTLRILNMSLVARRLDGGDSSRVQIGRAVRGQLHLCRNVNCLNTEGDA